MQVCLSKSNKKGWLSGWHPELGFLSLGNQRLKRSEAAFSKYIREEGGSKQRRGKDSFNLKHGVGRRTNRYRLSTNIFRLKIRRLLASEVIRFSSKGKK